MDDRELLAKVFAGPDMEDQEHWMNSCDDRQSVPMAMLFLREAWKFVRSSKRSIVRISLNSGRWALFC